jgi:heat shock protein HspQ
MATKTPRQAKFSIGEVVRHKLFEFRGVIYDVDFEFNNSEEWYQSIPKDVRPKKDQPFYHLLAENDEITYEAYVSEQNLVLDDRSEPISHPLIKEMFRGQNKEGLYLKQTN